MSRGLTPCLLAPASRNLAQKQDLSKLIPYFTSRYQTLSGLCLMCGIFFSIAEGRPLLPDDDEVAALRARGPDSYQVQHLAIPSQLTSELHLTFASSVLALRGDSVQTQPLVDRETGSVLCWNGEAWKVDGEAFQGNDTARIFSLLLSSVGSSRGSSTLRISQVLSSILGPFAFVFYDAISSTLYYGRDRLGRRSLLIRQTSSSQKKLILASTGLSKSTSPTVEVPPDAIHCIEFSKGGFDLTSAAWQTPLPSVNKEVPSAGSLGETPSTTSRAQLYFKLMQSLKLRVEDIPNHSRPQYGPGSAKVAVLFSGGLDCTLLARIAHNILPKDESIDLINVAFENPRSMAARDNDTDSPFETCPDRITGRSSYSELSRVCTQRDWKFVAVNVPYAEAVDHKPLIMQLMSPHNTEMDLSIAMALYFAARGQGELSGSGKPASPETRPYTSSARVLLSGLGADELFAGYARHAAAFAREGFSDLADELELDFGRIGSRNLGRDDRMMSNWGKEIRYPYLDEEFVHFALQLPVWEKAGFRPGKTIPKHYEESKKVDEPEQLEPAKMLLRLVLWELDMKTAASERKRAIQFGAKTAKMDVGQGRKKGTDLLTNAS